MKALKAIYNNLEKWIAQACYIYMLITLFVQTFSRYVFHKSASWPEEIATYVLVWMVYATASFAVRENAHLRIDSVMGLYPQKARKYIDLAGTVLWLVLAIVIAYLGYHYMMGQYAINSRAVSLHWLPMWTIYLAVPVGHICLCIRLVESIIRQIRSIMKGGDTRVVSPDEGEKSGGEA